MKKLRGLDDRPQPLEKDTSKEVREQIPKFRRLYKMAVGNAMGRDAENAIELYQVGLKLRIDSDTIELEDAEFKLLKEKVEGNDAKFASTIHAQMILRIREDEKVSIEESKRHAKVMEKK